MKAWKVLLMVIMTMSFLSLAQAIPSIEGNWISKDDQTGEKRAVLKLFVENGTLNGRIERVFPKPGDSGICSVCPGAFKDKPILGLPIVWGLKEKKAGAWSDGHILDAQTGKIYRVKMTVKKNKLFVRGFVGVALLGRTQVWDREQSL